MFIYLDESYDDSDEIEQRRIRDRSGQSREENKSIEPLDLPHHDKQGTPHRGLQFSTSTVDLPSSRTISSVTESDAGTNSKLIYDQLQQHQGHDGAGAGADVDNNDNKSDNNSRSHNRIKNDENDFNSHNNYNNNVNRDNRDNSSETHRSSKNKPPSIHQLLSDEVDQERASLYIQNLLSGQSQKDLTLNPTIENSQDLPKFDSEQHQLPSASLPPPDFHSVHSKIDYAASEDLTTILNEDDENFENQENIHNDRHGDENRDRDNNKLYERQHPSISPLTDISVNQLPSYLNHLFPTQSEHTSKS